MLRPPPLVGTRVEGQKNASAGETNPLRSHLATLFEKKKDGSFAPWKYRHLATEGRVVKFQSGPPPNLVMRVAEVRLFVANELSLIPPEQAMVMELGTDLLPDVADANARVQVYREIYGADICAHGFVAMRLEWADEIKAEAEGSLG